MIDKIKPYLSFYGKSSRSQYWGVNLLSYFTLMMVGLLSALLIMSGIFGVMVAMLLLFSSVVILLWLVFAVTVRRCRDIGINPWFTLALLIPYLAIVPFVIFGCLKSESKDE